MTILKDILNSSDLTVVENTNNKVSANVEKASLKMIALAGAEEIGMNMTVE